MTEVIEGRPARLARCRDPLLRPLFRKCWRMKFRFPEQTDGAILPERTLPRTRIRERGRDFPERRDLFNELPDVRSCGAMNPLEERAKGRLMQG